MARCKKDLLWDGMILLLIKTNQKLEAMFILLFSIGTHTPMHFEVTSKIIGASQPFKSLMDGTTENPS